MGVYVVTAGGQQYKVIAESAIAARVKAVSSTRTPFAATSAQVIRDGNENRELDRQTLRNLPQADLPTGTASTIPVQQIDQTFPDAGSAGIGQSTFPQTRNALDSRAISNVDPINQTRQTGFRGQSIGQGGVPIGLSGEQSAFGIGGPASQGVAPAGSTPFPGLNVQGGTGGITFQPTNPLNSSGGIDSGRVTGASDVPRVWVFAAPPGSPHAGRTFRIGAFSMQQAQEFLQRAGVETGGSLGLPVQTSEFLQATDVPGIIAITGSTAIDAPDDDGQFPGGPSIGEDPGGAGGGAVTGGGIDITNPVIPPVVIDDDPAVFDPEGDPFKTNPNVVPGSETGFDPGVLYPFETFQNALANRGFNPSGGLGGVFNSIYNRISPTLTAGAYFDGAEGLNPLLSPSGELPGATLQKFTDILNGQNTFAGSGALELFNQVAAGRAAGQFAGDDRAQQLISPDFGSQDGRNRAGELLGLARAAAQNKYGAFGARSLPSNNEVLGRYNRLLANSSDPASVPDFFNFVRSDFGF